MFLPLGFVLRWALARLGITYRRRIGRCALCYAAVYDDSSYRLHRGELVHDDCVEYRSRR